jgi:hypothetical protein
VLSDLEVKSYYLFQIASFESLTQLFAAGAFGQTQHQQPAANPMFGNLGGTPSTTVGTSGGFGALSSTPVMSDGLPSNSLLQAPLQTQTILPQTRCLEVQNLQRVSVHLEVATLPRLGVGARLDRLPITQLHLQHLGLDYLGSPTLIPQVVPLGVLLYLEINQPQLGLVPHNVRLLVHLGVTHH